MSEDPEAWRTAQLRQQIRDKIEESIRQSGNASSKSSTEMENHVFTKAKTRQEYLNMAARLMIYLKDNPQKKQGMQQGMQDMGQNIQQQGSDPISSLQTLTSNQAPGSGEMHTNIMMPGQGPPINDVNMSNISSGAVTMVQGNVPQQISINQGGQQILQRMPQNRMVVNQMMSSNVIPQGQNPHMGQRPLMQNTNIHIMQRMGPPTNQIHQTDGTFYPNQSVNGPQNLGNQTQQQHFQQFQNTQTQMASNVNAPIPQMNTMQNTAPSMTPSPNFMQSPQGVMPSPMSAGAINQRAQLSVSSAPSPGPLNTPIMVNTQSPATRMPNDEQAYLEKLKQLSKYIEPLRKMIAKLHGDESLTSDANKNHLNKINNLLEIISDSNRRCSMETLLKCEQVLEKMELKFIRSEPQQNVASTNVTVQPKMQDHYIGQALIDAIQNNIKKPFFNHTLHRTFGPAVAALINTGQNTQNIGIVRKKVDKQSEVPDVLQGEIARLDERFKIQMDPLQHSGCKTINLICRLDDKDLPCVPSISLTVPESYPNKPPLYRSSEDDEYFATPFLIKIQKSFLSSLSKLGDNYSITTILNRWEMCVRQACN